MDAKRRLSFFMGIGMVFFPGANGNNSWIDIETPLKKRTTKSLVDGSTYHLVMSDEFNVENRTFKDGHDPMWTALDRSDDDASSAGGGSLQFYNSSAVSTENGFLKIATYLETTSWTRYDHVNKRWKTERTNFTSGMVQSWNKFCFTGGIVEVDVVFPGEPFIGGLWPAVWMLGNLGRATYEASTNNIWPWSFDTCDREMQDAQAISACNRENHYGMHPFQGRGATEIDIIEVMTGDSNGPLPSTEPPITLPYGDMTLQVAPGVPKNRPQSGSLPLRKNTFSDNGHTEFLANVWYKDLEMHGNTSINPFFYGTYLGETKPGEPVTRGKHEAFQADAVGAAHQLTPAHFKRPHTFRIEWQPGKGGRLDWYTKGYRVNETTYMEGDGEGQEWTHVFSLKDKSLSDLMGSQIPNEPTYLIFNTAISSTWGFPYDPPDWCPKCFDCNDPTCSCNFYPGFCQMLDSRTVAMLIDSVRVYQSFNTSAHVGGKHTLGCDPPDYPTREWITGHEYRYMRNEPFSYKDKAHSLQPLQRGGGVCRDDSDCGGNVSLTNLTAVYDMLGTDSERKLFSTESRETVDLVISQGQCASQTNTFFSSKSWTGKVCRCRVGFTGPMCLSLDRIDTFPSAHKIRTDVSPFNRIANFEAPTFMLTAIASMIVMLLSILVSKVVDEKKARKRKSVSRQFKRPTFVTTSNDSNVTIITGTSI
jgi:beta-glucanase (GH16 family)